jgi:hypothetical protein
MSPAWEASTFVRYTIRNFNGQFPTDDACLEQVSRNRWSAVHNTKNFAYDERDGKG